MDCRDISGDPIKGPIKIDREAKKASMRATWQGREIKIRVKYGTPDFTMEQAQSDLNAKLQKKMHRLNKKLNSLSVQIGKPIAPEPGFLDRPPPSMMIDPTAHERPVELKLIPLLRFSDDLRKNNVPQKLLTAYKSFKERLTQNKEVEVFFDDHKFTIIFKHQEKELNAILAAENLHEFVGGSLTITRQSLSLFPSNNSAFMLSIESRNKYIMQEDSLMKAAEKFFKDREFQPIVVDAAITQDNLIPHLLEKYQGICIGETHHDIAPKKFIIDHMPLFKKLGVSVLYMEHLFNDTTQKWLDTYLNSPAQSPMPRYLEQYLNNLDHSMYRIAKINPDYNYTKLVRAAKEAGIKIVGLDTSVSYTAGSTDKLGVKDEGTASRYKAMNFVAADIMKKTSKGGKFIALIGSGHVGFCENVPGVADIAGCPSLIIEDHKIEAAKMEINVKNFQNQVKHVGVYLQMPVVKEEITR